MMRRLFAGVALAIAAVIFCGVAAWILRVRALTNEVATQAGVARTLIAANAALDEAFARAIARADLHVVVADRDAGRAIDVMGNDLRVHPIPVMMPGMGGGMPPGEMPGMNPGAPGGGPRSPFVTFALQLARIAPISVYRGDTVVTIAPGGAPLVAFLAGDAGVTLLAIAGIAALGVRRATVRARGERAALLANLEERRAAAERYQRFLAETGHELRTPLTIVSGYVDILRSSDAISGLDERVIEGLRAETARMRVLVEKMLTLARLNSPVSVPRLLDVGDAAAEIVATAQRRFPERSIVFDAERSASIVIDGDDLTEALGNLIENAVKYAPDSPIAVRADVRGARASIAVSDRGPGIPAAERDAVFERFYRSRDRSGAEGLGLGLAIVKRVADRWNGAVDLESQPGRTVFTLSFPLADEESDADSR